MKIYFTSGKIEEWDRRKLDEFVRKKINEHHFSDITDFIIYQYEKGIKEGIVQ